MARQAFRPCYIVLELTSKVPFGVMPFNDAFS